jgi:uncharacterized protein
VAPRFRIDAVLLACLAAAACTQRSRVPPAIHVGASTLLADGHDSTTIRIDTAPTVTVKRSPPGLTVGPPVFESGEWAVRVRAGIVPGPVLLEVASGGRAPALAELTLRLSDDDTLEDGTPDVLRLESERDRQAFRRWFTYLAEAQYFQNMSGRPAEIVDCAALIRYAYREALRKHDAVWAAQAGLRVVPPLDSVSKYDYPHTPLAASIFRVRAGAFRASDLADGAFAQFADARTLWRFNCHRVGRELAAAQPGDLLFFRQGAGEESFHSMIYLGESQIGKDGKRYLVYHTGPDRGDPGEIRRPSVDEMMRFPRSEWRPLASNPGFLGVFRWNILCSGGTR